MLERELIIRPLESKDVPEIAKAFQQLDWNKTPSQYERYLLKQVSGLRNVYVAFVDDRFAGYLTRKLK